MANSVMELLDMLYEMIDDAMSGKPKAVWAVFAK